MSALIDQVRTCRGCGCDDNHACITDAGPCSWALLDVEYDTGVCSACAAKVKYHPLAMVSIGLDNEDEIDAILAFANSAPTYREDALEIIQTLSARESRGRS